MTEDEFWSLTPYEYQLLLERHRADCLWHEAMAAIQPALYAERHRAEKSRRQPYRLEDFTLSGMAKAAKRAERLAEQQSKPEQVWNKVSALMRSLGG